MNSAAATVALPPDVRLMNAVSALLVAALLARRLKRDVAAVTVSFPELEITQAEAFAPIFVRLAYQPA